MQSKQSKFKFVLFSVLSFLVILAQYTIENTEQVQLYNTTMDATIKSPCMTLPNTSSKIEIDISEQQLYLTCTYADGSEEIKNYPISSSSYGIGNKAGSNKTPLGLHRIEQKFGKGAPFGMIFKARQSTGHIAKIDGELGDVITTRVLWLKGLEPKINSGPNIDSYKRYIYIHGTSAEKNIGKPASHGCIRMLNDDVIELFDRVSKGTKVHIRRE